MDSSRTIAATIGEKNIRQYPFDRFWTTAMNRDSSEAHEND